MYDDFFSNISDRRNRIDRDSDSKLHSLIKKVSQDIDRMNFNTAIAAMMEFTNAFRSGLSNIEHAFTFLKLLSSFAPHIASELFEQLQVIDGKGGNKPIDFEPWPIANDELTVSLTTKIMIQVNGKVRDDIIVDGPIS